MDPAQVNAVCRAVRTFLETCKVADLDQRMRALQQRLAEAERRKKP